MTTSKPSSGGYTDGSFRAGWTSSGTRLIGTLGRAVLGLGVCLGLLVPAPGRAQDAPGCAALEAAVQDQPEPTRVTGPGQVAGMWFPMPTARLVLCEVEQLRALRQLRQVDAREIRLWERQVDFLGEQVTLAVQARDALEGVVSAFVRRARDAEAARNEAVAELDAWYRSPVLWVSVGVVVAVVLEVAAVLVLGSAAE